MAYIPILLSGVLYMILGMLWYSPLLFGNVWMQLSGITKESVDGEKPNMARTYLLSFLFSVVTVFILSYLFEQLYVTEIFEAIGLSVTVWFGFYALISAGEYLYTRQSWTLFAINAGYRLFFLIGSAIILVSF